MKLTKKQTQQLPDKVILKPVTEEERKKYSIPTYGYLL